ncbi:MAG TPA: helix-turn-helix domain-containing protein [Solirubrobacterales bacterium]
MKLRQWERREETQHVGIGRERASLAGRVAGYRRPRGLRLTRLKDRSGSPRGIRADLATRLRARLPEIEKAILVRVRSLTEPDEDEDPAYLVGMRGAVSAAVAYGIEGIEKGLERPAEAPPATVSQARRAAREGISLEIVLRRYTAGCKVLEDFVLAESTDVPGAVLREVIADQGLEIDRLMAKVAAEHEDELSWTARSSTQREAARIVGFVQGDMPVAPLDFDFDFDLWHVGAIFRGRDAERATRWLADRFGYRLLCAARDEETVWAWLSSPRQTAAEDVGRLLVENMPDELTVAIGESRSGVEGWRLTHREARMALQVMLCRPRRLTRGQDVVLLAGILTNETLVRSLLDNYLAPLEGNRSFNVSLLDTLRAYFAVGGNAAAAAATLGVTRHTVQRRIRAIEQILGRPIHACYSELVVALQLVDLIDDK